MGKSEEYSFLLALLLNTRFDSDLEQIYNTLSVKAKDGDEKSIKSLLQIGKKLRGYAKDAALMLDKMMRLKKMIWSYKSKNSNDRCLKARLNAVYYSQRSRAGNTTPRSNSRF